ncbi:MAG: hypothetical protein LW822_11185 [Phycisphaeraceae bacterium]|nr:hypothetical protein [Phycisphaeraceae bacterium]
MACRLTLPPSAMSWPLLAILAWPKVLPLARSRTRPARCSTVCARTTPVLLIASAYALPPTACNSAATARIAPALTTVPDDAMMLTRSLAPSGCRTTSPAPASATVPFGASMTPSLTTRRAINATSPSVVVMIPWLTTALLLLPRSVAERPSMKSSSLMSSVERTTPAVLMRPFGPMRMPLGLSR